MTPLTQNPRVLVLVDKDGNPLKTATNVAPDVAVETTTDVAKFESEAGNFPFVTNAAPVADDYKR